MEIHHSWRKHRPKAEKVVVFLLKIPYCETLNFSVTLVKKMPRLEWVRREHKWLEEIKHKYKEIMLNVQSV